jgi:indole-3-glycerol phosphate synthase
MAEPTVITETILDALVAGKREALERCRAHEPFAAMRLRAEAAPLPLPFAPALRGEFVRLIAEIKKASPAKGVLEADLDPAARARTYAAGGAAAISVLTEERRFLGRIDDLALVRRTLDSCCAAERPRILRKDFLFDPYQLYEARAAGADAVLLIVAALQQEALVELLALAAELRLGALVEVHDEEQVERALRAGAEVIGVNNRDLRTFTTDLGLTARLRPSIPRARTLVSESGIRGRDHVDRLAAIGVDAVLVGEALMLSGDLAASLGEFTRSPRRAVPVP